MIYQRPRGTADLFGSEMEQYEAITDFLKDLAWIYHFDPIQTPTFEHLELFNKSVGETSDIVTKEIYSFQDKGERWIALRPEGTAGVVRAYVENKMYGNQVKPLKLSYIMNLFRYERPQGGRMREFHQFGVEILGSSNVMDDVETIMFAHEIIQECGIKNVQLHINYLGTFAQRATWIENLKTYFSQFTDQLTADSIRRLEKNPLRILDDKVDGEKDFVKKAPKLSQFLNDAEMERFQTIRKSLETAKIDYVVDENLVRGLDYYTGIVFEFVSTDPELEGKATVIGGGRYGKLIAQTGGPDVEGIGFAIGIERLLIMIRKSNPNFFQSEKYLDAYVMSEGGDNDLKALIVAQELRQNGFLVDIWNGENRREKNVKMARKEGAEFIIFVGDTYAEVEHKSGEKTVLKWNEVVPFIKTQFDDGEGTL